MKEIILNVDLSCNIFSICPCIWGWQETYELVFSTGDVGDVHVVGRWTQVLKLLLSENVDGNQVNLCVTVLAGLGGTHFNNLAGPALDDNVTGMKLILL